MPLDPHFLFNTLHTISALMHHDVELADEMLARLGDLLRQTLDAAGHPGGAAGAGARTSSAATWRSRRPASAAGWRVALDIDPDHPDRARAEPDPATAGGERHPPTA